MHILAGYGHARGAVGAEIEHHTFVARPGVAVENAVPDTPMIDGFGISGLLCLADRAGRYPDKNAGKDESRGCNY